MKQRYSRIKESLLTAIIKYADEEIEFAEEMGRGQKCLGDSIIEKNRIFDFLRTYPPDDIIIVLNSKKYSDSAVIRDVGENILNAIKDEVKEMERYHYPPNDGEPPQKRKRGGQKGLRLRQIGRQYVAKRIYRIYGRYYPNKRGVYGFIAEIFTTAGVPMTAANAKKLITTDYFRGI